MNKSSFIVFFPFFGRKDVRYRLEPFRDKVRFRCCGWPCFQSVTCCDVFFHQPQFVEFGLVTLLVFCDSSKFSRTDPKSWLPSFVIFHSYTTILNNIIVTSQSLSTMHATIEPTTVTYQQTTVRYQLCPANHHTVWFIHQFFENLV